MSRGRNTESGAAQGARRATEAAPDSVFLPLDIVILLFGILSNHCPKKSWGGGVGPVLRKKSIQRYAIFFLADGRPRE